jgi:histidinol phosphatase-like enzyme
MIGDKDSDIELGKMCNMKTIYIENKNYVYGSKIKPDFYVKNLLEASKIIKS